MAKPISGTEIVGKLRQAVELACTELGVSQRKACQTLNQYTRSSQRYEVRLPVKDAVMTGIPRALPPLPYSRIDQGMR